MFQKLFGVGKQKYSGPFSAGDFAHDIQHGRDAFGAGCQRQHSEVREARPLDMLPSFVGGEICQQFAVVR